MNYPSPFLIRQPLQPNGTRAKNAILFFRIVSLVLLLGIVLNISLLRSVESGGNFSQAAQIISSVFGLLNFCTQTLLIVFFLLWMQRAYSNLHRARVSNLSYSAGWATASWFIPFIQLLHPYLILREIWHKTQTAFQQDQSAEPKETKLIKYWWQSYISSVLVSLYSIYFILHAQYAGLYFSAIINNIAGLVSALYAVRMIRNIAEFETAMQQRAESSYQAELNILAENYRKQSAEISSVPETGKTLLSDINNVQTDEDFLSDTFVENTKHARLVIISLYCLLPFLLAYGVISFLLFSSISEYDYNEQIVAGNKWMNLILPLGGIIFLVCIVAFMLWTFRAYQNLSRIRIIQFPVFGPNMAIAGWLVPVLNFAMPLLMLLELAKKIPQSLADPGIEQEKKGPENGTINIAWITGLCGFLLLLLTENMKDSPGNFRANMDAAIFGLIAAILGIVSILLMINVMREFSKAENQLFERVEKLAAQLPDPEAEKTVQAGPDSSSM